MTNEIVIPTMAQFAEILGIEYDKNDPVRNLPVTLERARQAVFKMTGDTPTDVSEDLSYLKKYVLTMDQMITIPNMIKTIKTYEYLIFTGTQLIDTEFIPNNNSGVEIKIDISSNQINGDTQVIFGGRTGVNIDSMAIWKISKSAFRIDYGSQQYTLNVTPTGLFEIYLNKNVAKINSYTKQFTIQKFTSATSLRIASTYNSTAGYYDGNYHDNRRISGKIYYVKVYDNGTLIRDYVPAKDTKTGIIGLYDKVNKKMYPNKGSGNFQTGPETGYI